ncbi:MAG TPA: DUF177 domain-containing protein [Rhodothermales bacterium]|nr:DUF177 domain-containing protein [Rhodothermales bacterium]
MLPVRLTALSPGLHPFDFTPSAADLDLDPEAFRDVHVDGHLDVAATRIVVHLTARAVIRLTCDRTLVEFDQAIEGRHLVVFTTDPNLADGSDDDLLLIPPDASVIDLAGPARDTLVLAVPARAVAPGAEDVELPTQFGTEEIDPRWEGLLRLRGDDPS